MKKIIISFSPKERCILFPQQYTSEAFPTGTEADMNLCKDLRVTNDLKKVDVPQDMWKYICTQVVFFGKKQIIAWIAKAIFLEAVNTMIM